VTPAERWGRALDVEMSRAGMTAIAVAREVGCDPGSVRAYRRRQRMPRYQTAIAIADLLMAPPLAALAAQLLTKRCDVCERPFVDNTNTKVKRRCSKACASTAESWLAQGRRSDRHALNSKRLNLYTETVDRVCREWCPNDGICPDPSCPIQVAGLSPLPVVSQGERTIGILRVA